MLSHHEGSASVEEPRQIPLRPRSSRSHTGAATKRFDQQDSLLTAVKDDSAAMTSNEIYLENPDQSSVAANRKTYYAIKRGIDILGAAVALTVFSPIMLLAAILVKLTDFGPLFYCHPRVGLNGREFKCFKFRTMVVDADKQLGLLSSQNSHSDSRTFKIPNDPRVTWIGKLLRRSSIDELPQLFNVLSGEMSLVGPRPPVPREVAQYSWNDMRRLEVKPGLTCIWQVSGRSRLPFPEQLAMDIEYIENQSLWLDLNLIARTFPAVLSADGAY